MLIIKNLDKPDRKPCCQQKRQAPHEWIYLWHNISREMTYISLAAQKGCPNPYKSDQTQNFCRERRKK